MHFVTTAIAVDIADFEDVIGAEDTVVADIVDLDTVNADSNHRCHHGITDLDLDNIAVADDTASADTNPTDRNYHSYQIAKISRNLNSNIDDLNFVSFAIVDIRSLTYLLTKKLFKLYFL